MLFYAAAGLVVVGIATTLRVLSTFRDGAIAWSVPIDEQPITATVDSGKVPIDGLAQHALVLADEVNAVSTAAIVAAIAVWALAALVVLGGVGVVAWNFLRGRFFVHGNERALTAAGWALIAGPMLVLLLETMGRNGVLAALGLEDVEPVHPIEFWSIVLVFAAGVAVGLIARGVRRGIRLQRANEALEDETRGLV